MHPFRLTVLLGLMLGLGACGKYSRIDEEGFTDITFTRGAKAAAEDDFETKDLLVGGILIYIQSENFATNLKITSESSTAKIRIPNGRYSFFAFGYDSNSVPLAANARCDVIGGDNPVELTGTETTIPLTLTSGGCASGAFVDSQSFNDGTQFKPLEIVHCSSGTTLSGFSGTSNCSGSFFASANRYRINVPIFTLANGQFNVIGTAVTGDCQTASTSGAAVTAGERFPIGTTFGNSGIFPIEIETFTDVSCTSTPILRHQFHKGLIFGAIPGAGTSNARVVTTTSTSNRLFLRQF